MPKAVSTGAVTYAGSAAITRYTLASGEYGTYFNPLLDTDWNYRWASGSIFYSFPGNDSRWVPYYSDEGEPFTLMPFGTGMKAAAREALAAWSAVANLDFTEVVETAGGSQVGVVRMAFASLGYETAAWGYSPGSSAQSGDIWVNGNYYDNSGSGESDTAQGGYLYLTLMHEIGHALGLKHPFDTSGPVQSAERDNYQYSIMSYTDNYDTGYYPVTPMVDDILAIQYLYGANTHYRTGDDTYRFEGMDVETIWDARGVDTLDASAGGSIVDLREGRYSSIAGGRDNIAIAYGVSIENATGSAAADTIHDNAAANRIDAKGGGDTIYSSGGADTIDGGAGDDQVVLSNTLSYAFTKIDATRYTAQYTQDGYSVTIRLDNIENLAWQGKTRGLADWVAAYGGTATDESDDSAMNEITGSAGRDKLAGTDAPDALYGLGGNDTLRGGAGNDTLDGGAGTDWMEGGAGDDQYWVDGAGDRIIEKKAPGLDCVYAIGTYTLPAQVENLTLTGNDAANATGNGLDNVLLGNAADNRIKGGAGNDTLEGGGGNDTLAGGAGDDVFCIKPVAGTSDMVIQDFSHKAGNLDVIDLSFVPIYGISDVLLTQDSNGVRIASEAMPAITLYVMGVKVDYMKESCFLFASDE